jgi:uncharacterized membrane protein
MKKSRLEAFSDGVLAIIITIMVLELHVPHAPTLAALGLLWPVLLSYLMSYVFIGIYWNNHHHLWQVVEHVNGPVLWANLHLLFWLSLVPFVTAWMGENQFAAVPVAVYGVVLLGSAVAYYVMTRVLLASHAHDSLLAQALGRDFKGRISLLIYGLAIVVAFRLPWLSGLLYGTVSVIWLVPDRRMERVLLAHRRAADG